MRQIKGTLVVGMVKTVRRDKSGTILERLGEAERNLCRSQILPAMWYPFETYKKLFNAVVEVVAGGDLELVRQWGRVYSEEVVSTVYRSAIVPGDPIACLAKYEALFGNFYSFGTLTVERRGPAEAKLSIRDFDPGWEPAYHLIRGWLEQTLVLGGAREPTVDFEARSWQGDPETRYHIRVDA
jgi:uncharacterized protein (TIGR02265 family)